MKLILTVALSACMFLSACSSDDDDSKAKTVDKTGSVEVTLSSSHLDSLKDQVTTHYIVWNKGLKVKEFDVRDTVPSLGNTNTEAESDSGQTKNINVRKDYDFFVTVK
jgi:hypothetical protein